VNYDMKTQTSFLARAAAGMVACALALGPAAFAQQGASPPAQPAAAAGGQAQASGKTFTQKDLDELLAPIALYPDALLAQIFMASTYPLEIVEAARWQKQNASLKDKALEDALQQQTWDPSVKALTALPQVLTMMNEKLDWTTKLGDAFLAQQEDMLKTVQTLRTKADQAGNLKSSEQMTVSKATENNVQVIKIESPKPETVYVPTYNPATVYGTWWYSYPPPYYYYPPGYAYGSGLAFATGVVVGAAIWGNIGWGNNNVNINVNKYNNFNKTNISNGSFNHSAEHRKGAAYRDNATASKYNRGGDRQAAASRDQFRGRAEQGRSDLSSMDRGQLNNSISAADRSGGNRGGGDRGGGNVSAGNYGGGGNRGGGGGASASTRSSGGFSGAGGGGASARAASSRGSASRGGGGGGRGGGRR
jgi:uncharacterized membrane protein YgcG